MTRTALSTPDGSHSQKDQVRNGFSAAEVTKAVLDTLQAAGQPLTERQIEKMTADHIGLNPASGVRVRDVLLTLVDCGLVRSAAGDSRRFVLETQPGLQVFDIKS